MRCKSRTRTHWPCLFSSHLIRIRFLTHTNTEHFAFINKQKQERRTFTRWRALIKALCMSFSFKERKEVHFWHTKIRLTRYNHGTDRRNARKASCGHSSASQNNDNQQLEGPSIRHILFSIPSRRFANKFNICLVLCVYVANLFCGKMRDIFRRDRQAQADVLIKLMHS